MNVTLSHAKAGYLDQVRSHLADIPAEDLEDVIQDLEVHLLELDDSDIEAELGTPAQFADEFRTTAGLLGHVPSRRFQKLRRSVQRLEAKTRTWSLHLGELIRWQSMRPSWIWVRGWLLVAAWGGLVHGTPFRIFPIPSVGQSTVAGLVVTGLATAVSVWVDQAPITPRRRTATRIFSIAAGVLVGISILNPLPGPGVTYIDPGEYIDRLTAAGGKTVENIYAYDLDGNPVQVLLFDQDGQPLLTQPEWLYERAQFGEGDTYDGEIRFAVDEFGRIIPNLYPLDILRQTPTGSREPIPPPWVGLPSIPKAGTEDETSQPATTTTLGPPQQNERFKPVAYTR